MYICIYIYIYICIITGQLYHRHHITCNLGCFKRNTKIKKKKKKKKKEKKHAERQEGLPAAQRVINYRCVTNLVVILPLYIYVYIYIYIT